MLPAFLRFYAFSPLLPPLPPIRCRYALAFAYATPFVDYAISLLLSSLVDAAIFHYFIVTSLLARADYYVFPSFTPFSMLFFIAIRFIFAAFAFLRICHYFHADYAIFSFAADAFLSLFAIDVADAAAMSLYYLPLCLRHAV